MTDLYADNVYIGGSSGIVLSGSTLRPASSTSYLGNTSYKWRYGYITDLYTDNIYSGGSSGIVMSGNTLRPANSGTYYAYLGNSSYYWHYAFWLRPAQDWLRLQLCDRFLRCFAQDKDNVKLVRHISGCNIGTQKLRAFG